MSEIAQKAWDAVKAKDDAPYAAIPSTLKEELGARVDGVRRTGQTVNPFEEKVKELLESEKNEQEPPALGTTGVLNANQPPNVGDETEKSLDKMTRAELDVIAEKELGLNPSDYSNKQEIVSAIEAKRKESK